MMFLRNLSSKLSFLQQVTLVVLTDFDNYFQFRGDADRDIHTWERFLAGSLAGGISQTAIYPLEVSLSN
jgi:hypothetical protein